MEKSGSKFLCKIYDAYSQNSFFFWFLFHTESEVNLCVFMWLQKALSNATLNTKSKNHVIDTSFPTSVIKASTFALLSLLVSLVVFCACCRFLKLQHSNVNLSREYHPFFTSAWQGMFWSVLQQKKRTIKFTFLKRAECKYLCKFRKLIFGMVQSFKPCFLTIMAIAFQSIEGQKGDCCEKGEKLEAKLMAEMPCGSGGFWNLKWIVLFG